MWIRLLYHADWRGYAAADRQQDISKCEIGPVVRGVSASSGFEHPHGKTAKVRPASRGGVAERYHDCSRPGDVKPWRNRFLWNSGGALDREYPLCGLKT